MAKASLKTAAILRFPTSVVDEGDDEVDVALPPTRVLREQERDTQVGIDLADLVRLVFLIGPGRVGKTTLARWIAEQVSNRGAEAIAAAADPQKRSLADYVENVAQPDTNDAAATTAWLGALLRYSRDQKKSAYVDLGAGDTSLSRLLDRIPDLSAKMEESGVAPVAIYVVGPRIDDLASVATFEQRGFQPKATAIILNEGVITDPTMTREEAFAHVLRHRSFKEAVGRGALHLWMPRMDPAVVAKLEAKRLNFSAARDGIMPAGRKVVPLDVFERSIVAHWLAEMGQEMAPILGWLPR